MRPLEPEQASQPKAEDGTGDRLREALDRNRELLAIIGALPGAAYRYVRRADGTDALPFVSERALAVLGIPAEDLRRNPRLLLEGFSEDARARLDTAMRQPAARVMPIDVEVEIEPRATAPRWVRFVARPSVLGNGDVAWDGVILDVDDDVRTRLSHELFATAVENAADAIEITDARFRLQYVNPAFEHITGYAHQDVIGKTPGSLVRSGHFDAAYYETIERTIQGGKVWRGELIARRKDGDLRYQEATISPVVDAGGAITQFIAVKRDVTERRAAEAALAHAHAMLADAVECIAEGLALFDAEDRLILHNRKFTTIFPFLAEQRELAGMRFEEMVRLALAAGAIGDPKALVDPEGWVDERLRLHRNPLFGDLDLRLADGRWIEVKERRTGAGGIVGVWSDITELQRREAATVEAKNAAEIANRAKTTFLANMSHELRTPLNAIIGFAELLSLQLNGPLGHERYLGYARDIGVSGEHLLKVINDILDLTRIEAGGMEIHDEPVRFSDLIESSLRFIRDQATRAGLAIAVESAEDLPRLRGDPRKLRQVLINLLSNAVKFTPRGGRIRIEAARAAGGGLLLRVADTGIGMAADDIAQALTPFKQIDNSLARKYEGAGLGLPLAKNLVELHGGALEVMSELGQGTIVTCGFPLARTVGG
jgi:PAS domain S-box-containing protein